MHEVVAASMISGSGGHTPNDRELICLLTQLRKEIGNLNAIRVGGNWL